MPFWVKPFPTTTTATIIIIIVIKARPANRLMAQKKPFGQAETTNTLAKTKKTECDNTKKQKRSHSMKSFDPSTEIVENCTKNKKEKKMTKNR